MHNEHHTSHMAPGFGKNTNGFGIFIIAAIFVMIGLFAWWLWNNNNKYYKHYRIENIAASGHGHSHSEAEAPKETSGLAAMGQFDSASGNFIYNVGDEIELKMPDGSTLKVGGNSTEAKLFRFLTDANVSVDEDKTKGWITCDRIYFETGSANLSTTSQDQINRIGAILKAFPNAEIKVGGYTDNTGSAEVNTQVSGERATMVANSLKTASGRQEIASEGYGPQHPIAPNDTDEGRALNRRVDVRVTKK
jgi:outer membrane protein OmpA-like peptidoglycan-associated protein